MHSIYRYCLSLVLSCGSLAVCSENQEQYTTRFIGKEWIALDDAYYLGAQALAHKGDPQAMVAYLTVQQQLQQLVVKLLSRSTQEEARVYLQECEHRLSDGQPNINRALQIKNDFSGDELLALDGIFADVCRTMLQQGYKEAFLFYLYFRKSVLTESMKLIQASECATAANCYHELAKRLAQCTAMQRVLACREVGVDQLQQDSVAAELQNSQDDDASLDAGA